MNVQAGCWLLESSPCFMIFSWEGQQTRNSHTCTTFPLFCFFKVKNLNANSGYRSKHQSSVILFLVSEDFILLFKQQQTVWNLWRETTDIAGSQFQYYMNNKNRLNMWTIRKICGTHLHRHDDEMFTSWYRHYMCRPLILEWAPPQITTPPPSAQKYFKRLPS